MQKRWGRMHLAGRVLQRMLEHHVCPDAGARALQGVQVGLNQEGGGGVLGDEVADLPQGRVPWGGREDPLQQLRSKGSVSAAVFRLACGSGRGSAMASKPSQAMASQSHIC